MSDSAISMDGVWKKFRRGERHDSLRDLLPAVVRRVVRGPNPAGELLAGDFWALRDVSFEIPTGDALGIIGHTDSRYAPTYARMLGRPLHVTDGEVASFHWSMAFNLPAGVYEVGYHIAEAAGGYHDHKSRAYLVTVGDDPRVTGESFVDLRLEARRLDGRAVQTFRADPVLRP